ncbi:MAG: DUF4390 domain-containing protein [Gammaproteobacteria bacterium]
MWGLLVSGRRARTLGRGLIMLLLLLVGNSTWAAGFAVNHAEIVLTNKVYQLNARLTFDFSQDVMDAIENGVPMVLNLDIEIMRPRRYFWDEEVASLEQRYQLQYHALSEQYVVRNLNSGAQYTFFSLTAALQKIGNVDHLPIIDQQLLKNREADNYYARVRVGLGFDNLPVPLKLDALISSSWWLDSDWYRLDL